MSSFLPSIRQLQYVVALADHGHFGRAAAACFASQSTLSAGLKELEALLGATLVERTRRTVRFTPLGADIAERARQILRGAEDIAQLARAAGEPLTGALRMSVIPTIAPFLLPRVLPALREAYPALRLRLREETTAAACEGLHAGRADCVLLALPYACGDVELAPIGPDALRLAAPEGHPSLGGGEIPADELLLLEDGHCLRDHALGACERADGGDGSPLLGTSLHTLVAMVDGGVGVTLLPEMAVEAGILAGTRVRTRPLPSTQAVRTVALAWRRSSPRGSEFRLLAGVLAEVMAGQGAA